MSAGASPAKTVTVTTTTTASAQAAAPAPAKTVFKTVTTTPKPVAPIEEGVWEVGVDVKPGRYKVVDPITEDCYWEITKTGTDNIVDNGTPTGGRPVVTLRKGESFENQGCGTWGKVG